MFNVPAGTSSMMRREGYALIPPFTVTVYLIGRKCRFWASVGLSPGVQSFRLAYRCCLKARKPRPFFSARCPCHLSDSIVVFVLRPHVHGKRLRGGVAEWRCRHKPQYDARTSRPANRLKIFFGFHDFSFIFLFSFDAWPRCAARRHCTGKVPLYFRF